MCSITRFTKRKESARIVAAAGFMLKQENMNAKRREIEKNSDGGEVGHIANLYGVLDATELASFVKLAPDLELRISLAHGEANVDVTAARVKSTMREGRALIDLFKTRIDVAADVREQRPGTRAVFIAIGSGERTAAPSLGAKF